MEAVITLLSGMFLMGGLLCGMYAALAVENMFLIPCVVLITLGAIGLKIVSD